MPVEPQPHPDGTRTDVDSKLGLKGYKLGRGRSAKVLCKRAEVFKWLEQQKIH
ncbi:hypothetical protein ACFY9A_05535 [Streptomyces rubradiris]|uniref:hypothetical protein n=1 Tax=Streptomyces rubradiris TaxID=285531 RepID=UPI0036E5ED67